MTQTCFATETLLNQMAEKIGISPWEIRFRNAIRPGQTLPNAQIVGEDTGLVETLLAVKDEFENAKYAGIACCMKNAGLGHGIPDWGRCRLVVEDGNGYRLRRRIRYGPGRVQCLLPERRPGSESAG